MSDGRGVLGRIAIAFFPCKREGGRESIGCLSREEVKKETAEAEAQVRVLDIKKATFSLTSLATDRCSICWLARFVTVRGRADTEHSCSDWPMCSDWIHSNAPQTPIKGKFQGEKTLPNSRRAVWCSMMQYDAV